MNRRSRKSYGPEDEVRLTGSLLEASDRYGVDRKTIRATVARYIDFPRVKTGGTKHGWEFNWEHVDEWLKKNTWYRGERQPTASALKRQINVGTKEDDLPLSAQKIREDLLSRDNKGVVQTKLLQLELDKKMGVLVEREDIIGRMSVLVARLAKQLDMMPNLIGKKMGLPDDVIRMLRDNMDQARSAFVNDSEAIFAPEKPGE